MKNPGYYNGSVKGRDFLLHSFFTLILWLKNGGIQLTLEELGNRIHIEVKELEQYKIQGLLIPEEIQNEKELEQLQLLDDLARLGLGIGELRQMRELMKGKESEESQLRLLKKWRFQMLDEIHGKQQSLDRLDYVIYKIREKSKTGKLFMS